jgi:CheY-like chemotaxis protein
MAESPLVFIVDDDPINNFICEKMILRAWQAAQVSSFTNPIQALEKLQAVAAADAFPSYLFLDINMPEMDGWEFLSTYEQIPETLRHECAIYILSSTIDPADIDRANHYHLVSGFVSKPLTEEKIAALHIPDCA